MAALNSALELKTTVVQLDGITVKEIEIGQGRSSVIPIRYILLAYHGEHYQAVKKVDNEIIKGDGATIEIISTSKRSDTTMQG